VNPRGRRTEEPIPDYAIDVQGLGVRYNLRLTRQTTVRTSFRDLLKKREGPTHFWALRDVSFRLVHGESLAVIGPNGAGKSTLLQVLAGIIQPNEGSVDVVGQISSLLTLGAGFDQDLTGRDNIRLAGAFLGIPHKTMEAALPGIVASLLLLWQTRTGPAAQMMAVVGGGAIIWYLLPRFWGGKNFVSVVFGSFLVVAVGGGMLVPVLVGFIPEKPATPRDKQIGKANNLCGSMWGLRPVAMQPRGVIMTFVDLGPRLITVTHHDSITGPYHRNGQQIADVMNFWRGSEAQAHALAAKYHLNYVLSCPGSSTTTIFVAEAPKGFYVQLQRNQIPRWLTPVQLPKNSPYRMWKVTA